MEEGEAVNKDLCFVFVWMSVLNDATRGSSAYYREIYVIPRERELLELLMAGTICCSPG